MLCKTVPSFASMDEINIQTKAIEQQIPVALLIYAVQGGFMFFFLSQWMKSQSVTIQMNAVEQYFPVILFTMLHKVVLSFESVDEILTCYLSNESN